MVLHTYLGPIDFILPFVIGHFLLARMPMIVWVGKIAVHIEISGMSNYNWFFDDVINRIEHCNIKEEFKVLFALDGDIFRLFLDSLVRLNVL